MTTENEELHYGIGELAAALSVAQGDFKPIERKSVNPFFKSKYADLESILKGVREALTKNGLSVVQSIQPDENHAIVESYLLHKSGQWIKSTTKLKPKANDPQSMGSAITYARRYGISALLCIATEDEDDGNNSSTPQKQEAEEKVGPGDQSGHWCSTHQTKFFKTAKMKSYAHPIKAENGERPGQWCYEHTKSPSDTPKSNDTEASSTNPQVESETAEKQQTTKLSSKEVIEALKGDKPTGMTVDDFLAKVNEKLPKWSVETIEKCLKCSLEDWGEPWEPALDIVAQMGNVRF